MNSPEDPVADRPATAGSRPGWLMATLVASLAINFFVIAMLGAYYVWGRHDDHRGGRISTPGFTQLLPRKFFGELSDDRRGELRSLMHTHRKEFRDGRRVLRQAAHAVAEALEAEPFDQSRLNSALEEFTRTGHSLMDLGAEVTGEVVAKLTPDERKVLAGHLFARSRSHSRSSDKRESD